MFFSNPPTFYKRTCIPKVILTTSGSLSGAVKCSYQIGIDSTTGNIYYRDSNNTWQLASAGTGGGGGGGTPSNELLQQELLTSDSDYTYMRQAGYYVMGIIIIPGSTATIKIGSTEGGNDIVYDEVVNTAGKLFFLPTYATTTENFYISGLPTGSKIIVLKQLIDTGNSSTDNTALTQEEVINTNSDYIYTRQSNFYTYGIIVIPGSATTVTVGTSAGANDIIYDTPVSTTGKVLSVPSFATTAENFYIGGLTNGTKLIILKGFIDTTP